jgi:hypothetical protein
MAARDMLCVARGPVVVDVRIDPDVRLPRLDRVAAMSPGAPAKPGAGAPAKPGTSAVVPKQGK